jgi:metal-responsive CopG/Arc/MetJ family transcriptional regulator
MKTVLVSLPNGIYKLLADLKGEFGESNSEIVRTIVISFLSEKGYLSKSGES